MTTLRSAEGYIESREVDGQTMYFAQIDHPLWYGPLRGTTEEAQADGRARCAECNLDVPCFNS